MVAGNSDRSFFPLFGVREMHHWSLLFRAAATCPLQSIEQKIDGNCSFLSELYLSPLKTVSEIKSVVFGITDFYVALGVKNINLYPVILSSMGTR